MTFLYLKAQKGVTEKITFGGAIYFVRYSGSRSVTHSQHVGI